MGVKGIAAQFGANKLLTLYELWGKCNSKEKYDQYINIFNNKKKYWNTIDKRLSIVHNDSLIKVVYEDEMTKEMRYIDNCTSLEEAAYNDIEKNFGNMIREQCQRNSKK